MENLTREELFDLVWTTPMTKLATRFGVSDVALAKTCARFDIPRPGRGYWQQLAAGIKPRRPRLPTSKVQGPVALDWGLAFADPPVVAVPEELSEPHDAIRWLRDAFTSAPRDEHGRLIVGNGHGPSFCVTPAQAPRALRLLDVLAKTMVGRGREVLVGKRYDWSPPEFLVQTQGCVFALEVEEILASKPHEPTAGQKKPKSGDQSIPQHDLVPDGELRLKLMFTHRKYVGQKSWSDKQARRLEDLLGRVVLAVEKAGHIGRIERDESLRLEEEWRTEERKRLRPERLRWYAEWLMDDLDRMLDDWDRARRIREFVEEYKRRLPEDARTDLSTRWVQTIEALAEGLDPMGRVTEVAKELEPSDTVLAQLIEDADVRAGT